MASKLDREEDLRPTDVHTTGKGRWAELRDPQAVSVKRKGTIIQSVGVRKREGQDRKLRSENWIYKFRISDVENLEEC